MIFLAEYNPSVLPNAIHVNNLVLKYREAVSISSYSWQMHHVLYTHPLVIRIQKSP